MYGRIKNILAPLAAGIAAAVLAASCGLPDSAEASGSRPGAEVSRSGAVALPPSSQAQSAGGALAPLPLAVGFNALTGLAPPEGMLDGQRPVAVMVANNTRSLPQRGLAAADVMVELVTEGGITRLMALYADYRAVPQVGPVRSTRDAFVQLGYPGSAILVHIGSSVYAGNLISVLGYKDIDGIELGSTAFWFDAARGGPAGMRNEYCWFTDAELIWKGMEYIDVVPTAEVRSLFVFSDTPGAPSGRAGAVHAVYSPAAATSFAYSEAQGLYTKLINGAPHTDEDGTALCYQNVFLLRCGISLKPDGQCTEFDLSGGDGYYFTGGGVTPLTWTKGGPESALRLFDAAGNELAVARGKSYIGFLPADAPGAISWDAPVPAE